jgi:hypothetical protein
MLYMGANRLAKVVRVAAVATKRCHQKRNARLMLHDAFQHDLVSVRPMIPAVPAGKMTDLFLRLRVTVVGPIDLKARTSEMGKAGRQAQAVGSGRGYEAVEFGDPIGIERIQGPTEGVIVELRGSNTGRNEAVGGFILEKPGDEVERLLNTPQAIEHHRFDGFPDSEVPQFRVLVGGSVDDVAQAEFVEHASHKTEVVQHLAMVWGLIGHNNLL